MAYKIGYSQKKALYFDGSSDCYATHTPSGAGIANLCPQPSDAWSLSFWCKGCTITNKTWIGQFDRSSPNTGFVFYTNTDNAISFFQNSYVSGATRDLVATSVVNMGVTINKAWAEWFHLTGTYDGTGSLTSTKIYVNAIDVTDSSSLSSGTAGEFAGGTRSGTNLFTTAAIADVSGAFWSHNTETTMCQIGIYDTALTATQVSEIYNGQNEFPGPCDLTTLSTASDIVGYWLNDNAADTSATLQDDSGNNYDLTTSGMSVGYLVQVNI